MKLRKSSREDRSIFQGHSGKSRGQEAEQRENFSDLPGSVLELNLQVTNSFKEKNKYVKNRCMKVAGSVKLFLLV